MAQRNCQACDDLRTDAPNFTQNGLTNTEIASLKNNTGLNPSSGNDDCTDLNNMNDCLIGNMESEVDAYDVCEWRTFMKEFIGNAWSVKAAIIAAICGLWAQIKSLWAKVNGYDDKLDNMCKMIDGMLDPPLSRYGTLPNKYGDDHPANRGGTIATKNGTPVLVAMEQSELTTQSWNSQNVGLYHGKQQVETCSTGACQIMEWIAPNLIGYKVHPDITLDIGDLLWVAPVSALRTWGFTEDIINAFTTSSWTWLNYGISGNPRGSIWVKLSIEGTRIEMSYEGKVGADQLTANRRLMEDANPARLYRFSC